MNLWTINAGLASQQDPPALHLRPRRLSISIYPARRRRMNSQMGVCGIVSKYFRKEDA